MELLRDLDIIKLHCKFNFAMSRRNKNHFFPYVTIPAVELVPATFKVVKGDGWRVRNDIKENLEAGNIKLCQNTDFTQWLRVLHSRPMFRDGFLLA